MPSDPEVYPITTAFEKEMEPKVEAMRAMDPYYLCARRMYERMRSNIGEYEHGSVDIEDVFKDIFAPGSIVPASDEPNGYIAVRTAFLKTYVAVCTDVLETLLEV